MSSSSPLTQCRKCYQYGHHTSRCKAPNPRCPLCVGLHPRNHHRCGNAGCEKGGNTRPVAGCCATMPLACCLCGRPHSATSPLCQYKADALERFRTRSNRVPSSTNPCSPTQESMDIVIEATTTPDVAL